MYWPVLTKLSAKNPAAMIAMPDARPSMLSSRLMAFVMPINQKMASAMFSSTEPVQGRRQTVVDNERRSEDLSDQFLVRLDVNEVVDESDQKQETCWRAESVFRKTV